MIRLRQSGVDEILIKRVQDWYDPGLGVFIQSLATASFSPTSLFTPGVNGVWYDPSDITTLFQDAAGTTPVTAVEQPVGRMLDKSGRGNHAVNNSGNSANFPVLSARYNLLTKTEQFDDAVWFKTINENITLSANATTAPDGTSTAYLAYPASSGSICYTYQRPIATGVFTISAYVKSAGKSVIWAYIKSIAGNGVVYFDISNQTTQIVAGSAGTYASASINSVGNGWHKIIATANTSILLGGADGAGFGVTDSKGSTTIVKNGTDGVYIWGADLRVANDALNQPSYQRVNTSSDYDTMGFKRGEVFDGINDYLTASAGGGSTTSFFWCSAIRVGKVGAVQTLFSDAGTNTGYRVRINASNQLELRAGNGTAYTTVSTAATLSIGQRSVLTAWHDGTNLNVQIDNGTVHQAAFSTATAGTAQFTIGKDNNAASNFFAGWLYEKVYTKDNVPSSAQIADTKAYVANIAGITL